MGQHFLIVPRIAVLPDIIEPLHFTLVHADGDTAQIGQGQHGDALRALPLFVNFIQLDGRGHVDGIDLHLLFFGAVLRFLTRPIQAEFFNHFGKFQL